MKRVLIFLAAFAVAALCTGGKRFIPWKTASAASHTAPVFRAASSAAVVAGTVTITKPSGTVDNDYMVALLSADGGSRTITAPTGWTSLGVVQKATGDGQTARVFGKKASSEGASYDFTFDGGAGGGTIVSYSGVDTTTAIDVASSTNSGVGSTSPTTVTGTGVTTATDHAMVLWLAAADQGANHPISAAYAPPSGFTERVDYGGGGEMDWTTISVAEKEFAATGATGDQSGTFTSSASSHGWIAFLVALRPQ